jgi:hypothetical protein
MTITPSFGTSVPSLTVASFDGILSDPATIASLNERALDVRALLAASAGASAELNDRTLLLWQQTVQAASVALVELTIEQAAAGKLDTIKQPSGSAIKKLAGQLFAPVAAQAGFKADPGRILPKAVENRIKTAQLLSLLPENVAHKLQSMRPTDRAIRPLLKLATFGTDAVNGQPVAAFADDRSAVVINDAILTAWDMYVTAGRLTDLVGPGLDGKTMEQALAEALGPVVDVEGIDQPVGAGDGSEGEGQAEAERKPLAEILSGFSGQISALRGRLSAMNESEQQQLINGETDQALGEITGLMAELNYLHCVLAEPVGTTAPAVEAEPVAKAARKARAKKAEPVAA